LEPTLDDLPRGHARTGRAMFTAGEIDELSRLVGVHRVEAGTPLLRQGDPVKHIGVIVSGDVELLHRRATRRVVVQVLHPGDLYGDIPLLCGLSMPFSARTLTDAAVIELPHDRFWQLVDHRPDITRCLLFSLASRVERLQRRLLAVTSGDLSHQVSALLLDEVGDAPGEVRLSQATIAELLGSTRPTVNRVLHQLADAGHVTLGYRRIEVVDPSGLQRILG